MVNVLIGILITLLSPIKQYAVNDGVNKFETRIANMIDLSKDSTLQKILTVELSTITSESDDKKGFFIVRYGKFKKGILLKISKYPHEILNGNMGFIGYTLIGDKIVLFEGDNSINFKFSRPDHRAEIKRYVDNNAEKIKESLISYYYILDDIYAKYSQKDGWTWSDGNPDL